MKTPSRGPVRSLLMMLSIVAIPLASWAAGCGDQREGERCDHKNGDADCNTGLICKPSTELGGNADICCPPGTSQNPECIPGGGTTSTSSGSTGTDMSTSSTTATSTSSSSTGTGTSTSSSTSGATTSSTSASTGTGSSSSSGTGGAGGGSGM